MRSVVYWPTAGIGDGSEGSLIAGGIAVAFLVCRDIMGRWVLLWI